MSATCCVFNNAETIDTNDPCVCNAPIGATLVTSNGIIYIRTIQSEGCEVGDWQLLSTTNTLFEIQDIFSNNEIIGAGEVLTFSGINGANVTLDGNGNVIVNGRMFYSGSGPVSPPTDTTQIAIHVNCSTAQLYAWCPSIASWIGPIGGSTGGGFILTDGSNQQAIDSGNILTVTSPDGSVTITVSATDTLSLIVDPSNLPIDDNGNFFVSANIEGALQELGALMHPPATFTNNAAAFSWNVNTQSGNIPQAPSLNIVNQTFTFQNGAGNTTIFTANYVKNVQVTGGSTLRVTFADNTFVDYDLCDLFTVCQQAQLSANFIALKTILDINEPVQFIDQTNASLFIQSWLWEYNDGSGWVTFSNVQSPVYAFSAPGLYSIRLTVTDSATQTDFEIKNDYINVASVAIELNMTYTIPTIFEDSVVCEASVIE